MILVALISGGLVALVLIYNLPKEKVEKEVIRELPVAKVSYAPEEEVDFVNAAKTAVNQVVHVMSSGSQRVQYSSPFDFIFGGIQEQVPTLSSGSGVIISKDGYVVTNNHVIEQADEIEVILNNKQTYKAKIIGRDQATDIALLKIESDEDFSAMPYGNSDDIEIGEWVLAIGNPFNLNSTVTAGIVSAKARSLGMSSQTSLEAFIQTDAAVNPGNSGGALVNTRGELIGINTAIASRTGSYVGYSFAIPVNIIKKVVSDLMEYGEVQRALIGVSIYEINAQSAQVLDIEELEGVYVKEVTPGGAAYDAGIEEGDIIVEIEGSKIRNSSELYEKVGIHRPGDQIKVTVIRNEKPKSFKLTLKNRNNQTEMKQAQNIDVLGAVFKSLDTSELKHYGLNYGVQITQLNPGKLRAAGIREHFIVTKINHQKIKSSKDINAIINHTEGGILIEGIYPNGHRAYYAIGLD